jgi:hypothetical protein
VGGGWSTTRQTLEACIDRTCTFLPKIHLFDDRAVIFWDFFRNFFGEYTMLGSTVSALRLTFSIVGRVATTNRVIHSAALTHPPPS